MKKRILAVILMAVMALSAIGCGGSGVQVKAHEGGKKVTVNLGEYKGIALKGVTDAEYDNEISTMLSSMAKTEEYDGVAENGDTVNINYIGIRDGVPFEGGTDDSEEGTDLTLGSGRFIDGFEEGLLGTKKGDVRELNLTFPDPYPNNPDLAGQPVIFKVTVKAVKRTTVPELTDELAQGIGYDSKADLEKTIREELDKAAYQQIIAETMLGNTEIKNMPADEISNAAEEMYASYCGYCQSMATNYGMDFNTVLYYMTGYPSTEEFKAYVDEYTDKKVKYQYIVEAIYEKEKLSYTDEEFMERAMVYAEGYGFSTYEEFETEYTKETIIDAIKMDIVIDYIIDNATKF